MLLTNNIQALVTLQSLLTLQQQDAFVMGDLLKRLSSGLLYFKSPSRGDQSSRNVLIDQNNPKKWGDQIVLTQMIRDELVFRLSENLNLDEVLTFDLLDSYFLTDDKTKSQFSYLTTVEKSLQNVMNELSGQQQMAIGPHVNIQAYRESRLQLQERLQKEFQKTITDILTMVQIVYFDERRSLLESLFLILDARVKIKRDAFVNQLNPSEIAENLIKSLEYSQKQLENWLKFERNTQREILTSLQREEIYIYKCLFLVYRHYQVPNASQILRFMKYVQENNFGSYVNRQNDLMNFFRYETNVKAQDEIITDLTVLNSLNILQIHLFAQQDLDNSQQTSKFINQLVSQENEFTQLQDLFDRISLNAINTPVYLAFRQIINLIMSLNLLQVYGIGQDKKRLFKFDIDRRIEEVKRQYFMEAVILMNETQKYYDEEFVDRRGELTFLLQDWLNLVYPFLNEQAMEDEKKKSKKLAFEILKDPVHLRKIWQQISSSSEKIIGQELAQRQGSKLRYRTLDIFDDIMINPIKHLEDFTKLMICLCGSKKHKDGAYELKVVDLLRSYKEKDIHGQSSVNPEANLMQIIIKTFDDLTTYVAQNLLSDVDFLHYANICVLLSKMIAQRPFLYEELNDEFLYTLIDSSEDIDAYKLYRGKTFDADQIEQREPMLGLLMRAIHSLFIWQNPADTVVPLKKILKTISKIYKNLNLQSEILSLLHQDVHNFQYVMIEYFKFNFDQEKSHVTEMLLRFMNSIMEKDFPQGFQLPEESRINLHTTFIGQALTQVYQKVLEDYFTLNFRDVNDFANLSYRLIKLTNNLLLKYKDITPMMRTSISHKLPQFDPLLQILTNVLNQFQLDVMVTSQLLLAEDLIDGVPSGLQNRFWIQQLQMGRRESHSRAKITRLVRIALQTYNTMLELSLINAELANLTPDQLSQVNARTFYLSNLRSIQTITNHIMVPSLGPTYDINRLSDSTLNFTLFNIFQYYVKPHSSFCPQMSEIQIEAIKFFQSCCKIWDIQTNRPKVSLESIIRSGGIITIEGVNYSDFKTLYTRNFIDCINQRNSILPLQYIANFLSLLILCANSQQAFLEDLLKDQQFSSSMLDLLKIDLSGRAEVEVVKQLQKDVQSKLVILLSEMSVNRICNDFMKKVVDGDILKAILDNIISKLTQDVKHSLVVDYKFILTENFLLKDSNEKYNLRKSLELYQTNQSLITLKYYFRLLAEEYSRNPLDSLSVRTALAQMFQDNLLQSMQLMVGQEDIDEIYQEILQLNQAMATDQNQIDGAKASMYNQQVLNYQVTPEQMNFMNNSKLMTNECKVWLNNLDATQFHNNLAKLPAYSLLSNSSLECCNYGFLGSEFTINTDELLDILRTYFFKDENFLAQAKIITSKYNMLLSYLYSYHQLTESIKNFILSVGKTRTRENQRNKEFVLKDRVINTSLFVLVENKPLNDVISNEESVKGIQNRLARIMINILSQLLQKSRSRQQYDHQQLYFHTVQLEQDLDYLTVVLGVINNLATIAPFSQDNLKSLESINRLVKLLPSLRLHQLSLSVSRDIGKVQKLESDYNASKIYVNLVLQTFSVVIMLRQSQEAQQREREEMVVKDVYDDLDFISILSHITKIMQEGQCIKEGLQIFEQALMLVSHENLMIFMKKPDPPLRMIVSRFLNSYSTTEECIKIIQFLTAFSKIEEGAQLLIQENILYSLGTSAILARVNREDLYLTDGEFRRNPVHILWCQVLIFIRTLNSSLIHQSDQRKIMSSQLRIFEARATTILNACSDQNIIKTTMSLALYEEIDLITGCLQQIFSYADQLDAQDIKTYSMLKDSLLFSVTNLFASESKVKPNSASEQYMNGIQHDGMKENLGLLSAFDNQSFTGLDLIVNIEKVRIFLNMNSALLNMLLINQQDSGYEQLNTWERRELSHYQTPKQRDLDNVSHLDSHYTNLTYMQRDLSRTDFLSLELMSNAVFNYIRALTQMNKIFNFWIKQEQSLSDLYRDINGLFKHDEWIVKEYQGLNHYFAGNTFKEILEQFESAMQMGYLVTSIILQNLVDLQKKYENEVYVARLPTTPKDLMDYADMLKKICMEFNNYVKESRLVQPSMTDSYQLMAKMVDHIKNRTVDERF